MRGGEFLGMSRACLREREERGRHPVIYTRDKDPLYWYNLEGGERRRAPENVQGLPEGEGGEGRPRHLQDHVTNLSREGWMVWRLH